MKGFRDTSKMMSGHNFARGGHSMQAHFPVQRPAPGLPAGGDSVNGLTKHGLANSPGQDGHSQVQRRVQPTMELETGGGKTPLNAGYAKGGNAAKHFHVHKHIYAKGGKVKTISKSYLRQVEGAAAMQAEQGGNTNANGGFTPGSTGGSRSKFAKGGKSKIHIKEKNRGALHRDMGVPQGKEIPRSAIRSKLAHDKASGNTKGVKRDVFALNFGHKGHASGGHIHDDTHEIAPDYATGGTINRVATGGTINRLGAGGALYSKGGRR